MKLLSKSKLGILFLLLLIGVAVLYQYLGQIKKKDMAEYAPASTAAFVEVDSLSTLFSNLVKTKVWQKLAPSFGISKQIEYLTGAANVLSMTGLGPEDADLLARAQYALVLDSLEIEADKEPQKQEELQGQLAIVPKLALVIETHSRVGKVQEYVSKRSSLLAQRIYGAKVTSKEENFQSIPIKIFQSQDSTRYLAITQQGSVVIIGNYLPVVKNCLSVLLGQQASLKNDPNLQLAREKLGTDTIVFGFVNGKTIGKTLQILTNIFPNAIKKYFIGSEQNLPADISSQIINGIAYSMQFKNNQLVEHYFTLLKPELAVKLKSIVQSNKEQLDLTSFLFENSFDFTSLLVNDPSKTLEEVLAAISSHTNVVASFALRQVIISAGKSYGVVPEDPIGDLLSNEIALVKIKTPENDKTITIVKIKDKLKILPTISRYLRKNNEKVNSEDYQGVEIVSNPALESRAIAFLNNYLLLASRNELIAFIDIWHKKKRSQISSLQLGQAGLNAQACLLSAGAEKEAVGDFFLAISHLLRTTDGNPEILNNDLIKSSIEQLPPITSVGEFVEEGLMVETTSSLGSFTLLSALLETPNKELKESETSLTK